MSNELTQIKNLIEKSEKNIMQKMDDNAKKLEANLDVKINAIKKSFESQIKSNNQKIAKTSGQVNALENNFNEHLQIQQRLCFLQVNGIAPTVGENLTDITNKLSSLIGFDSPPKMSYFRIKNNVNNNDDRIMLRFGSELDKDEFFARYIVKASTLTLQLLRPGAAASNGRIFISPSLSKHQYEINKLANRLKKEGKPLKTRIIQGYIMIKFSDKEPFHRFNNAAELQTALSNDTK